MLPSAAAATDRASLRAVVGLLAALATVLGLVLVAPAAPADAARGGASTISRKVIFTVRNTASDTSVLCSADQANHKIRGRLVGPRRKVYGRSGSLRINILVHDVGTGAWFWNLPGRRNRRYDYASRLAAKGQLSLVVDRLGYDRSRLRDGDSTCLGAQAQMLHQLVIRARAGQYRFVGDRHTVPAASFAAVHAHGQGALVAEIEAATFDDVNGLILMGWSDGNMSARERQENQREQNTCSGTADYASYGNGARQFNQLLFSSATRAIRRAADRLRNDAPCGDVSSLNAAQFDAQQNNDQIEAPVLLMYGKRDARVGAGAVAAQKGMYSAAPSVSVRRYAGQGSALVLERKAPRVQRDVLAWLRRNVGPTGDNPRRGR